MNRSQISDAERAFLANAAYQASPVTRVPGNTGDWIEAGKPGELGNGLEIYALTKPGTNEVVFAVRGSDTTPIAGADWGVDGANMAFSGRLHSQFEEAIRYVDGFMDLATEEGIDYVYSTTGHSKGGRYSADSGAYLWHRGHVH